MYSDNNASDVLTSDSSIDDTEGEKRQIDLMKFFSKNKITINCLRDTHRLLKTPTSDYKIRKQFTAFMQYEYKYFIYCSKCKLYIGIDSNVDTRICTNCEDHLKLTETNFFVYIPIKQQIMSTLLIHYENIMKYKAEMEMSEVFMSDIHNGLVFKNIHRVYKETDIVPLSLTLNTDGAKMFENNPNSVWPVQIQQNYLPPNLRFLTENIIVVVLYYGPSKDIDFLQLLKPCAMNYNILKRDFSSISWQLKLNFCH